MKGLLLKDLYILKHIYAKNLLLVLVLYTGLGLAFEMPFFFNILGWMFGFYAVGLLSAEKASNWDFYASTLPLKKSLVVGEKFVLLLLCGLVGFVYSTLMAPLVQWRMGTPLEESLFTALTVSLFVLIYFGLMMPFTYKFGVEKARTGMLLCLAAFGGAVFFLGSTGKLDIDTPLQALQWANETPFLAMGACAVAAAALYLACWGVSVVIYSKKEF